MPHSKSKIKEEERDFSFINNYLGMECFEIKREYEKCLDNHEKKWFFKKKLYERCSELLNNFQYCLINNNMKSINTIREKYHTKLKVNENMINQKVELEQMKNDFKNGKISEEEFLKVTKKHLNRSQLKEIL